MNQRKYKQHAKAAEGKRGPRITISLPQDLYGEVEVIAARQERSRNFVIRKAVERMVQEEQPLFNQSK
jgi:metal-responsive CopG/Arc/MetJ family transcriptional regulator